MALLRKNRLETIAKNFGLYIHIPFCRTKCRYCGFYSVPVEDCDTKAVINAEVAEMQRHGKNEQVKTIYIGGGSPSCLEKELLLQVVNETILRWRGAKEITIEVNPGQVSQEILNELRAAGVNRLSIGAQSFNQNELDFLGRGYNAKSIIETIGWARIAGFENISLDLIFAIPKSTLESYGENLKKAIDLGVEHISAYSLSFEEGTVLYKQKSEGKIKAVDEETDREMYEMTIDELGKAGLMQYEISNFAKQGFECLHNLNYWANGEYIGIGPGATTYLDGVRRTNIEDISKYVEVMAKGQDACDEQEKLSDIERACETAVLNLRRRSGMDLAEFKMLTGFDAEELFAEQIEKYKKLKLMEAAAGRIYLTRKALGIADSVLCDFA